MILQQLIACPDLSLANLILYGWRFPASLLFRILKLCQSPSKCVLVIPHFSLISDTVSMEYSLQNNNKGTVLIRVLAPEHLAASFLAFIEQKSRENVPKIKLPSSNHGDDFLIKFKQKTFNLFDQYIKEGYTTKSALSATNYALKTAGFANSSYDIVKQVLSKSGRLSLKNR
jgi:hypothetical protein